MTASRFALDGAVPRACGLLLLLLAAVAAGCTSSDYLKVRKIPSNPLAGPLQLLSRQGPQPSQRTNNLLARYDLAADYKHDADKALLALGREIEAEPTAEKIYAYAELSYVAGKKAEALGRRAAALDLFGASVAHSFQFLFDPNFDRFRNPYDPQFRRACDLYNGALESALRLVHRGGNLRPGVIQRITTGDQQYDVAIVLRGKWRPEDIGSLQFVSDYEIEGLTNRNHTYGLGVPLIAIREPHPNESPAEEFYPPGLSFPVTAFLRVMPEKSSVDSRGVRRHACVLELYDPLATSDIMVAGHKAPLETDITTPLAYLLDHPAFRARTNATLGLLNPNGVQQHKGLYMLEPFDPHRIPVVMVHGLWSSPVTWMEMFNDLRSFPEVRERYQFWFYLYPTGQPFWISAVQFRNDLAEARAKLDPHRQIAPLDRMVLVGHSMGGLVSRLQTIESGDDYWRLLSEKPFQQLNADHPTREKLAQALFFRPNQSVSRVITLGTPHRGSEFANDYTRWFSRKLITLPAMLTQLTNKVVRDNPNFFHDTELLTINTSIDSLAPDSPILPVMLRSPQPPWIKHHNVVGVVSDDSWFKLSPQGDGDGVVAFASAHLDNVQSEIVVEADHMGVHRHPRSILEVRRILLEHWVESTGDATFVRPASHAAFLPKLAPASSTSPLQAAP